MRATSRPTFFRGRPDPFVVIVGLIAYASVGGCRKSTPPATVFDAASDGPGVTDGSGTTDAPGVADASGADLAMPADAVPLQCRVASDRQPPFQVTFRLSNHGPRPVYLHQGCVGIAYDVSTCASRYTDSVGPTYVCACDCNDVSCRGGVACGPCPPDTGVAVAPGEAKEVTWAVQRVVVQDRGTYSCYQRTPLPAALYSVTVPVFDALEQATTGSKPRFATRTFEVPAPGDVVEVSLPALPSDGGAPDAALGCDRPGAAPVCAAPWDPTAPCSLDTTYTFGPEGGNSPTRYTSTLVPPNTYTRTRTALRTVEPPLSCSNALPRCGASNDTFTTADVLEAFAAPDVVAALAQATPQVYGYDPRPVDGTVFAVTRSDGHGLLIGASCAGGNTCARPITDGIARLATILRKIDQQQLALPGCEALRQH